MLFPLLLFSLSAPAVLPKQHTPTLTPIPPHTTPIPTPQCKHLLAVRLAPVLGRLEEREVNDELYESYVSL